MAPPNRHMGWACPCVWISLTAHDTVQMLMACSKHVLRVNTSAFIVHFRYIGEILRIWCPAVVLF